MRPILHSKWDFLETRSWFCPHEIAWSDWKASHMKVPSVYMICTNYNFCLPPPTIYTILLYISLSIPVLLWQETRKYETIYPVHIMWWTLKHVRTALEWLTGRQNKYAGRTRSLIRCHKTWFHGSRERDIHVYIEILSLITRRVM